MIAYSLVLKQETRLVDDGVRYRQCASTAGRLR